MTWSLIASGRHGTNHDEHELLRHFVDAAEEVGATITTGFTFNGNHVQATSLADARKKLAAYDATPWSYAPTEDAVEVPANV